MEPLQADDPTQVGRYRLVGRLGVGGMGRVYAATGPDGRRAAIKVIRDDLADDTGFRHRFRREVAAASAVALAASPPLAPPPSPPYPYGHPRAPSRRRLRLLGAGVLTAVVITGVVAALTRTPAAPTPGPPTVVATAGSAAPTATVDPNSQQARYVDRLCASGTLLSTLGSTAISPTPGSDPARLKRDFLTVADRTIGTVEAALPDLTVLRDEAPNDDVKSRFGLIVSEFTKARNAFTAGRTAVAAAEPLTVDADRAGVNSYLDGTRSLALAATVVKEIKLPPSYTAASGSAPHCRQ